MGQTQTKLASNIVEDEIAKESTLNLMKHAKTQNIDQKIDIEKSGGDVIIGKINLDAAQTISVASVETYKLVGSNAAEIAHKAAENLVKTQNSPFFQKDVLDVSNTIKTHIESQLDMTNITKDIIKQLTDQQLIIKDTKGNVKIGEVSFKAQATIVSKAFKSAVEGAQLGVKILEAMNLKNEVAISGPIGNIAAQLGLSYRQTVLAIAAVVGLMVLGTIIFFSALMFSGGSSDRIIYANSELR